jgi:hypothetical protein
VVLAAIIRSGAIVVSLAVFAVLYIVVVVAIELVSIISLVEPVALPGPTCSPIFSSVVCGCKYACRYSGAAVDTDDESAFVAKFLVSRPILLVNVWPIVVLAFVLVVANPQQIEGPPVIYTLSLPPGTALPLQFAALLQSFGPALAVPVEKAPTPPEPLPVSEITAVNGTPAVSAVPMIDPAEPDQVIVEKYGCVEAFNAVRKLVAVVATSVVLTVDIATPPIVTMKTLSPPSILATVPVLT